MTRNIIFGSIFLAFTWTVVCAQGCEKYKIKFNQLEGFIYKEFCGGGSSSQNALLGSGTNLDCGINGTNSLTTDQILIGDTARPSYTRNLCLNVHGVDYVEITYRLNLVIVDGHSEDLTSSTGWTRFCTSLKNQLADSWAIQLVPKYDGSNVMVKNSKLALCTPVMMP